MYYLNLLLWTALVMVMAKVLHILWQRIKHDLYVPPEPKPFEDDLEEDQEELGDDEDLKKR